jgi:hypothetical protein
LKRLVEHAMTDTSGNGALFVFGKMASEKEILDLTGVRMVSSTEIVKDNSI